MPWPTSQIATQLGKVPPNVRAVVDSGTPHASLLGLVTRPVRGSSSWPQAEPQRESYAMRPYRRWLLATPIAGLSSAPPILLTHHSRRSRRRHPKRSAGSSQATVKSVSAAQTVAGFAASATVELVVVGTGVPASRD